MKKKKKTKGILRYFQQRDIIIRIYFAFAFVLALTGGLTGTIFINAYRTNYVSSYTKLLSEQGKNIAERVENFSREEKEKDFENFSVYIDEILHAENTDVWIVASPSSANSLNERYTNAEIDSDTVASETKNVLERTFSKGTISSYSDFDTTYGMTTLSVAIPIKDKEQGDVIGAVLMVSMIDMQTMGIDQGKKLISYSVLMAIIIAFFVSVLISKWFLSTPLKKIEGHIGQLARGDYQSIQVKHPHSQIGMLEASLDSLAGELRQAETERHTLEQVRRDFFANVSHELRTPITVMRGYTESLADGVISDPKQVEEYHQRILSECQGMERLVQDLFILSKMQNPDFEIEKEPVSLIQVFGDILKSGKALGEEKRISLLLEHPEEDPCLILGDYGRLRQMFMIIVDNAIKFSHEDSRIEIKIWLEEQKYHVSIRDYGIGISKEELPVIFEKFYSSKMRQNAKGTGLGLMIARQIAVRHDGDIEVESQVGKGSTFFFVFEPCTNPDAFE